MSNAIRQNNLQSNVEKARNCDFGAGFEYGVADGGVVAEKLWRAKRRRPQSCFTLKQPHQLPEKIALRDVQNLIDAAARQYLQSQQQRPPPPTTHSQRPPAAAASSASAAFNYDNQGATSLANQGNGSVHGQQQSQNQQYALHHSQSNTTSQPSSSTGNASVWNAQRPQQQQQQQLHQQDPQQQQRNDVDEFDDYDALVAGLDVDTLVAQQQQQHNPPRASYTNHNNITNASSNQMTYSFGGTASWNNFDYGSQWNSNGNGNSNSNNNSYNGAQSQYGSAVATSFGGAGIQNNYHSSFASYDNNNGSQSSSNNGPAGSFVHASELLGSSSTSVNHQGFEYSLSDSGSSNEAPLCPGHNLRCRALTARSAANAGRQFYKCSLPEGQQCDFFEWADGNQESNTAYGNSGSGTNAAYNSSGMVKDIVRENRYKFGHQTFRQGQEEVIRYAMQGRDVFVLMPTGGGKSLCYQLPAWCSPGLSVIVSPLLSLIQDQVQSLTKLGVRAVFISSSNHSDARSITQELNAAEAHDGVKLLYLTPEKINHSGQMQSILRRLYNKNLISRFVIDEAHCK
jgi:hypothetical protein